MDQLFPRPWKPCSKINITVISQLHPSRGDGCNCENHVLCFAKFWGNRSKSCPAALSQWGEEALKRTDPEEYWLFWLLFVLGKLGPRSKRLRTPVIDGFYCGCVSTSGYLWISSSVHGGSDAVGTSFSVTSFQQSPVYSGKSHLERNGAQEIEVILSSILHGRPIAYEEEILDP